MSDSLCSISIAIPELEIKSSKVELSNGIFSVAIYYMKIVYAMYMYMYMHVTCWWYIRWSQNTNHGSNSCVCVGLQSGSVFL